MIKKHWPILLAILVLIISIILGIIASNAADTGVAIVMGVIIFMFLFPVAGAVIGGWYGWRIKSPVKWLLAPAVYLGVVLYLIIEGLIAGNGSLDLGTNLSVGLFTGIACLGLEVITSIIAWLAGKSREDRN